MRARNMPTSSSVERDPSGRMAGRSGRLRRSARRLRRRLQQLPPGGPRHLDADGRADDDVYAFDINPSADELIPAPGTSAGVISEGDESDHQ